MDKSVVKNEFSQTIGRLTQSVAFLDFCEEVYGYRTYMFNMMDKEQIDYVLHSIPVTQDDTVLDLGCGIGSILEMVVAKYGCAGVGIDLLPNLDRGHNAKIKYQCGDIDEIYEDEISPSLTLSVDSLYFSNDLNGLVQKLMSSKNNRLYFFYSQYLFDKEADKSELQAGRTGLAQALCGAGADFQTIDFSKNEQALYAKMEKALEKRESAFAAEKNTDMYLQKLQEVRMGIKLFEEGRASRYLYIS